MATLQKFKLLATQCTIAGSPGRSPSASPVIHIRRRKTLRMLLNRSSASERRRFGRCDDREKVADRSPEKTAATETSNKKGGSKREGRGRRKLKELFVSSPPFEERESKSGVGDSEGLLPAPRSVSDGQAARHGGSLRQITGAFRYRLLRRAWRPVLVTIPE
ncbi:hypothetical protein SLA2020_378640 [Shorea laevis]